MSNLMLHCGATPMTIDQLRAMSSDHHQPLTPTHRPVPHFKVADMIRQSLSRFSKEYSIVEEQYGVSGRKATECFGAMSMRRHGDHNPEYEMFYGWRHSNAMRFSLRAGLGDRFFICDNMAFHIENECLGTKHTSNINSTFQWRIDELSRTILAKDTALHERNNKYGNRWLSYKDSDHLIMECVRKKALQKTRINLVDDEYRKPSFKYNTGGHSLLDLKHAMTHVAKGSIYSDQIKRSQVMHKVFDAFLITT